MSDIEISNDGEFLPALVDEAEASLAVGLSRAEIDIQITTARRFPRRLSKIQADILSYATLDDETAVECMYALPRGKKPVQGPSIRFAEIVVASFGNCRSASRVVYVDRVEKVVIAEGIFHDLETNVARKAEIRRRISDKKGHLFSHDMIVQTGNAASAIALRNAILGGVPKALWRKAYETVKKTIAGDVMTLSVRREEAIKALANYGVTPQQVFQAIEVSAIEDVTVEHIPTLRGMFAALKNGEATVEEMFDSRSSGEREAGYNPLLAKDAVDRKAGEGIDDAGQGGATKASTPTESDADATDTNPGPAQPTAAANSKSEAPAEGGEAAPSATSEGAKGEAATAVEASPALLLELSKVLWRAMSVKTLEKCRLDFWKDKPGIFDEASATKISAIVEAHRNRCENKIDDAATENEIKRIIGK